VAHQRHRSAGSAAKGVGLRLGRHAVSAGMGFALLAGCGSPLPISTLSGSAGIAEPATPDGTTFQLLYTFQSKRAFRNGWGTGPLIAVNGRFFGTTAWGGTTNNGAVYAIDPSGKRERAIYSFQGSPDGALAGAALLPRHGALYGTTVRGGIDNIGTVFSVTPNGEEHVLHSFVGTDGMGPDSPLTVLDGKLYGTTLYGGNGSGAGVVFEVSPSGTFRVIHKFGTRDQDYATFPFGRLVAFQGELYGVTQTGGNGFGTLYAVAPSGRYRNVRVFTTKDGSEPGGGPTLLNDLLYGVTQGGYDKQGVYQRAAIYTLQPPARFRIIGRVGNRTGGAPGGELTAVNGKLFGVSSGGGGYRCGSAMEIDASGHVRVIYAFRCSDGRDPSRLLFYNDAFFGTMSWGGGSPKNGGTIYRLAISP
jgi:uncharacterized repeat protein (TIGR03803 family)